MSYLFYGINSAVKYARDGYCKELSDFLSKKPHLINQKNKNGNSILHIASWKGDCEMVLMLLMRGADVNSVDSKGYTPLLVAIEFGHDDLAISLLERGADISIGNQALCMPLHVAALSGCKSIVIPLLQRGADINAIETNGCTPLLCALRSKHSDVAMILIDRGADLAARDRDDWLPVGLAKLNGMTAVVAAITLRYEYQNLARSRSESFSAGHREEISEKYEKSLEQRLQARQSSLQQAEPHSPVDEIAVLRSQSQPALMHTMTPSGSGASVTSASGASKMSKSTKKKRKERRASATEMSTSATTAAIEAVTQAMKESGGDISKAAQLLMQQQQEAAPRERRRSSRKEEKSDDFSVSVSVISEGTTISKAAKQKKRSSSSKDMGSTRSRHDDDDRSVQSGSTQGSKSAKLKKMHSSSSSRGLVEDDNVSVRSGNRKDSVRGGALVPIEEELVIRRTTRSASQSSRRDGRNESSFQDDVDSDGEAVGPPALFCFWQRPPVKKGREALLPRRSVAEPVHEVPEKSRGVCAVM